MKHLKTIRKEAIFLITWSSIILALSFIGSSGKPPQLIIASLVMFVPIIGLSIGILSQIKKVINIVDIHGTKKCPYCAEDIRKDALVCRHCRKELQPTTPLQSE